MSDMEIDALETEIKETQERLTNLRKEYREKKYSNLKTAIEAKREAERAVQEEWKALGYPSSIPFPSYSKDFFTFKW
jgi:hypothetical protein